MSKKEKHYEELSKLFEKFINNSNNKQIETYFLNQSNLPSRRANLELAFALQDLIGTLPDKFDAKLWTFFLNLLEYTPNIAPTNDPKEFLSFCGVIGISAVGAKNEDYLKKAIICLKTKSRDERWRIKEAVGFGIQKLLTTNSNYLFFFKEWLKDKDLLELRALSVGLAHPSVLKKETIIIETLDIYYRIFEILSEFPTNLRKSDQFKVLKKGLSYCPSVVASISPILGFDFLKRILNKYQKDEDIQDIIKQNLAKNRLKKYYPKEVSMLMEQYKP